jgi:hypothetical protein
VVDTELDQHLEKLVGGRLAGPAERGGTEDHPAAPVTRPPEVVVVDHRLDVTPVAQPGPSGYAQ